MRITSKITVDVVKNDREKVKIYPGTFPYNGLTLEDPVVASQLEIYKQMGLVDYDGSPPPKVSKSDVRTGDRKPETAGTSGATDSGPGGVSSEGTDGGGSGSDVPKRRHRARKGRKIRGESGEEE